MTASTELLVGDEDGEHVLIRALSRNHPDLFDYWDGNWVACEVEIAAGGFRGGFRADLRSEEFQTFFEEAEGLCRSLDGAATFSTMEGQMTFSLAGDGNSRVRVRGEARDAPGSDNRLQFGFDIEHTHVPQICRALEVLLAAFPVVGASTTDT